MDDQDEDAGRGQGREDLGLSGQPQLADRNDHHYDQDERPGQDSDAAVERLRREFSAQHLVQGIVGGPYALASQGIVSTFRPVLPPQESD